MVCTYYTQALAAFYVQSGHANRVLRFGSAAAVGIRHGAWVTEWIIALQCNGASCSSAKRGWLTAARGVAVAPTRRRTKLTQRVRTACSPPKRRPSADMFTFDRCCVMHDVFVSCGK